MLAVIETKFLVQHESCEYKCSLNENVCNSKQKQKDDECRCESRELNYCSSCKRGYPWNPSTCDCEYDKACKMVSIKILKIARVKNVFLVDSISM